jgi:hypothetical protein
MPRSGAPIISHNSQKAFKLGAPLRGIEQFALRAASDLPQLKADRLISEKIMENFNKGAENSGKRETLV